MHLKIFIDVAQHLACMCSHCAMAQCMCNLHCLCNAHAQHCLHVSAANNIIIIQIEVECSVMMSYDQRFSMLYMCQSTQHLATCLQAGWEGRYNSDEVYFYTLDALPIFVAFCVYSVLHFGLYLPSSSTTTTSNQHQPPAVELHKSSMNSVSILAHTKDTRKGGNLQTQELV